MAEANPPDTITTLRLDLVVIPPDLMSALIANDKETARRLTSIRLPDELFPKTAADIAFLRMRHDQVRGDPSWAPWSLRFVVLRAENVVIGTANFHGPPGVNDTSTRGAAEVGYEIFPAHRNVGFATEVAIAMLQWATRAHGVTHFISGVAPHNAPSLRVNHKLGFAKTGAVVDGEIIFELRTALA